LPTKKKEKKTAAAEALLSLERQFHRSSKGPACQSRESATGAAAERKVQPVAWPVVYKQAAGWLPLFAGEAKQVTFARQ
jgi:hypothetical protein